MRRLFIALLCTGVLGMVPVAYARDYTAPRAGLTVYDIGSGRFEFDMMLDGMDYEFRWFGNVFRVEGGGECFELERSGKELIIEACGVLSGAYTETLGTL